MIGNTMLTYFGASSRVAPNTKGTSSREIKMIAKIFGSFGKVFFSAYAEFFYFTLSRQQREIEFSFLEMCDSLNVTIMIWLTDFFLSRERFLFVLSS